MSYQKVWEVGYVRDRAQGRRRYVPATDTRAKLQELVDARVPVRAIARASGLSDTAVAHIIDGRHEQVQPQTAARIASLTLNDVYARASGSVPSVGAVRRVQALMALGWRKADLQAEGVPTGQLVTRSRGLISVEGWRQVRDVYDRLSMTLGPSQTARDRAAARGYPHRWRGTTRRSTTRGRRRSAASRWKPSWTGSRWTGWWPAGPPAPGAIPICD